MKLEDVPLKLLREFCSRRKDVYKIKHLSTRTKETVLEAMQSVDPNALQNFRTWLEERNRTSGERWFIESREPHGRRLTFERVRDEEVVYRRVYEEDY